VFGHQQLDADPDQQQGTDDLQEWDRQQLQREEDQDDAQHDGARRAPKDAQRALLGGSLRQASAITTALSPPSRMSIMMIWRRRSRTPGSRTSPCGVFRARVCGL